MLGLGIILSCIIGGTVHLLWQDNQLFRWKTLKDLTDFFFTKYGIAGKIVQMFFHYLRPGYHPDDDDYSRFARARVSVARGVRSYSAHLTSSRASVRNSSRAGGFR